MRWLVLIPLAVFLVAWWGYVDALPYAQLPYDDGYITQQYARRLFSTGMFTFDGVRPSSGATSPPHVILLALARQLVSDPVWAARVVGFGCHVAFLVVLFLLIRELGLPADIAVVVVSAAAFCGFLVVDSLNGLETSLFHLLSTALVLVALRARNARGFLLLAIATGFLCWCRPEGMLLVLVFLPVFLWQMKKRRLLSEAHPIFIALLFLGPVLIGAGTFGRGGMPSWRVKMFFHGETDLSLNEKLHLAKPGVAAFLYFLRWYLVIPFVALILQLVSRCASRLARRSPACTGAGQSFPAWVFSSLLAFVLLFYVVYTWCLPSSLAYLDFRYQHVLLPWVFVATAWGCEALLSRMRSPKVRRVAFSLLFLALFLGSAMTYIGSRSVYMQCVQSVSNVLVPLAERLARIAKPGDVIATHDIGALAYYSGLPIVDLVGLTDPQVFRMLREGSSIARDSILHAGHGFLVIHLSWDNLYLHIHPDEPKSGFRFLFETQPAFGDRYRVYRFGD